MDCMFKMMMYSNGYAEMDGPQTDGMFKLICSVIVVFKHDAFTRIMCSVGWCVQTDVFKRMDNMCIQIHCVFKQLMCANRQCVPMDDKFKWMLHAN